MLRSRVKVTTMLLVLIFSLTAGFCSAKDNKPPDSLLQNFDKFTQLLDSSQHEFSATGISETWLNDINEDYVNITGYRFISSNRVGKLGGGTGRYLRDTFTLNVMSDLCSSNTALFDSVFFF